MICPVCNKRVPPFARHCSHCGWEKPRRRKDRQWVTLIMGGTMVATIIVWLS